MFPHASSSQSAYFTVVGALHACFEVSAGDLSPCPSAALGRLQVNVAFSVTSPTTGPQAGSYFSEGLPESLGLPSAVAEDLSELN